MLKSLPISKASLTLSKDGFKQSYLDTDILFNSYQGGLSFSLPAVGCSLCQVIFTEDYTQEEHELEFRHKRRLLYKTYSRDRNSLLQTPHEHGLEMVVAAGGDTDIR